MADSRGLVPDINRTNNTGISPNLLHASVPLLTVGTPLTASIVDGQDLYYRMVVPPNESLTISAVFAVAQEAEFDLRYRALPDRSTFDQSYAQVADLQQKLFLPSPQGGSYYILLHGREGAVSAQSFTLQADSPSFEVDSFSPTTVNNKLPTGFTLIGAAFTPQTTVRLRTLTGETIAPTETRFVDVNHLEVSLDLTRNAEGSYEVEASDAGQTKTAPNTLLVVGFQGFVIPNILAPATVHVGSSIGVKVRLDNNGFTDALAPITQITATNVIPSQKTQSLFASLNSATETLSVGRHELGQGFEPDPKGDGVAQQL